MHLKLAKTDFLLCLCCVLCLSSPQGVGHAAVVEKTLIRVTNTSYGADRLGTPWTDTSLTGCIWSCISKYSSQCQTVMYNPTSNFCTPGSFYRTSTLGAALAPVSTEGFLYAPLTCDNSDNFDVISSTQVSACLYISNDTMDFVSARNFCSGVGAHLTSARSMDKFNLLPQGSRFLIGLTDLAVEGAFAWEDNGEIVHTDLASLIFRTGQPDNDNGVEHCVTLAPSSSQPSGKDVPCVSVKHRFACERPMLRGV